MTRIMYDAIDASKLPAGGDLYAGYVDGHWPSYDAIKARFPGKLVVGICTNPSHNEGTIGDGPPDNGTWAEWIAWVKRRRAAGVDPWINANESNTWIPGIEAFRAANVAEPHWWVARYDGNPVLPAGALMKQYASNDNYDTSSCAGYLPGIDPHPTTPTPPTVTTPEEDDMAYLISVTPDPTEEAGNTNAGIFVVDDKVVHVDRGSFSAYKGKFGAPLVIDTAQYEALVAAKNA